MSSSTDCNLYAMKALNGWNDTDSDDGGSVATDRATLVGKVDCEH